jgi:hypothetical protein
MTKAAELAKWGEVSTNGQVSGRRNIVINGVMNVAQRSASVADIGAAPEYFTCDRWKINTGNSAGRLTMTQTADGPVGFANCLKLDCTTADTSIAAGEYLELQQIFEGQDLQSIGKGVAGAKEITLSFYVKANAAFTFGVELYDLDNTRQITKLFNTTTGWVRHEFVIPADVDDGSSPFGDDNAGSMQVTFLIHSGSDFTSGTLNTTAWANAINTNRAAGIDSFFSSTDNNFFLTGVQMEVGSVATPFEHRSFAEELALCNRYYYFRGGGGAASILGNGGYLTNSQVESVITFPTIMRVGPSLVQTSGTNYYAAESEGAGVDHLDDWLVHLSTPYSVLIYNLSDASGTAGQYARIGSTSNGSIAFKSEL